MGYQDLLGKMISEIQSMELDQKVDAMNLVKRALHEISPFRTEPVDCVLWIQNDHVVANDYNPNLVAPPEMKLLEESIRQDGYTQPIVSWINNGMNEVVDGFHRNRVGKESDEIRNRVHGYLPVTIINSESEERSNRIAATIRHNRARGKHQVEKMSDIVIELKNRNWTNQRIAKNLGMDEDEILRLCQITGLAEIFKDHEFSKSWDIEDSEPEFVPLTEEFELGEGENFRTVNTGDENRIFHTHDKWECCKAGFYATTMPGMKREECEQRYAEFLSDSDKFGAALESVISEWVHSCEHYLTNSSMNRIAWLGQAAMCYATGIPSTFRSGFNLLSQEQQEEANRVALRYLNKWLEKNNRPTVTMEDALSTNQMDLY